MRNYFNSMKKIKFSLFFLLSVFGLCAQSPILVLEAENADSIHIENLIVRKGVAYIAIKQQDVVKVVKQGRLEGLKCGKDFGLLAYNDIPSYEVIDEGITSLSIDWEMMGNEAANFVLNNVPVQKFLPTEVRLRKSL